MSILTGIPSITPLGGGRRGASSAPNGVSPSVADWRSKLTFTRRRRSGNSARFGRSEFVSARTCDSMALRCAPMLRPAIPYCAARQRHGAGGDVRSPRCNTSSASSGRSSGTDSSATPCRSASRRLSRTVDGGLHEPKIRDSPGNPRCNGGASSSTVRASRDARDPDLVRPAESKKIATAPGVVRERCRLHGNTAHRTLVPRDAARYTSRQGPGRRMRSRAPHRRDG